MRVLLTISNELRDGDGDEPADDEADAAEDEAERAEKWPSSYSAVVTTAAATPPCCPCCRCGPGCVVSRWN